MSVVFVSDACVEAFPVSVAAANLGIGSAALTSASGSYRIVGLRTGSYRVVIFPGCLGTPVNLQTTTLRHSVRVVQGKTKTGVNAALHAGGSITGTVTGPSAAAVPGAAAGPGVPQTPGAAAVPGADDRAGAGPAVVAVAADVRDEDAMAAAVAEAERRWGGLDAALAVAGVIAGGVPLWEMPAAQQQAVLDIDLGGVLTLARVAIPALLRRPAPRQGRFLAVASAAATRGLPMLAAYCAAKAGVAGLIRALAVELRGTGVTANAVSPGSTDTPILAESARLYGLASAQDFAPQQPLDRLLRPEEVAAALTWLASESSSAMTGAVIPVDGGLAL